MKHHSHQCLYFFSIDMDVSSLFSLFDVFYLPYSIVSAANIIKLINNFSFHLEVFGFFEFN